MKQPSHAISAEHPTSTSPSPALEDDSMENQPSIAKQSGHTYFGMASFVLLVVAAPVILILGLLVYTVIEIEFGFAERNARAVLWLYVLAAKAIIWVAIAVSVTGLILGILGLTSVDKKRSLAAVWLAFHALIIIALASLICWFQRF